MKNYFYCAMHKTDSGKEYQSGIFHTDCSPSDQQFLNGLIAQATKRFTIPCSTGQVVILSLSLV